MFQTEINLFLQSFAAPWLTSVFVAISDLGSTVPTLFIIISVMFGFHFRNGLLLAQVMAWNGILTEALKGLFGLPRPMHVDSRVRFLPSQESFPGSLHRQGAPGFFSPLPASAVDHFRTLEPGAFGYPSGHSSSAMVLWGSLAAFFKKRWVRVLALVMIVAIPLSRLYLGRHFLADIMGGLALGAVILYVSQVLFRPTGKFYAFLFSGQRRFSFTPAVISLTLYLWGLPLLLLYLLPANGTFLAILLGLNAGFFILWLQGLPAEGGTPGQRLGRVLVAFLVYFAADWALNLVLRLLSPPPVPSLLFVKEALAAFLLIWGGTEANIRLGLYRR